MLQLTHNPPMADQPYFRPLLGGLDSPEIQRHDAAEASRIASKEQMAYDRALGRPRVAQPELPPFKAPKLPPDFARRVVALNGEIYSRGIAIDADKLLALGRERFAGLLAADRKAPRGAIGAGIDLTLFESVQRHLHAFEASAVPRRTSNEQVAGSGKERDQARKITGFHDLWKASHERQETLADIYAFRDLFASLVFGQSMLERLSPDGRVRSHFFCGGKGRKVDYFHDWLSVAQGPFTSVKLVAQLWHVMSWLTGEQSRAPSPIDLARHFVNVRSPSSKQVRVIEALLTAFLLDYRDWQLWEYVGKATRAVPEMSRLAAWRTILAKRYLGITSFHDEVRAAFYRDVGYGYESHREFDAARHRAFFNRTVQTLLDQLSVVLALAIEANFPRTVVARFQNQILCDGKPKQCAETTAHLAAAFPSATFQLEFTELNQ